MIKSHNEKIALVAPPWWLIPSENVVTATEHLVEDYSFHLRRNGYPNIVFSRSKDNTDSNDTSDVNGYNNEYIYTRVSKIDRRYFRNSNTLFFYLIYILRVALKIRQLGIRKVFVFQTFPFCFWIKFFNPQSKLIFHIGSHELSKKDNYFNYGYISDSVAYRVFSKIDTVIAVSKRIKRGILKRFPEFKEKCKSVYAGIDTNIFKEKKKNSNPFTIIFAGRVVSEKGVGLLVEAFKNLKKEYTDLNLYIVGGSIGPNVADEFSEIFKVKGIKMFGLRTRREVANILRKGTIFVYPVIMEEAFGLAPVEAMATGLVTVVSKTKSGYTEIIKDKENGYYFEFNSSKDLEKVLRYILSQDNTDIVKNGIRTVKEKLSWKECIKESVKYFD